MLCCVMLYALEGYGTTQNHNITLTVGKRYELKPSDYGYSLSQYRACTPYQISASKDEILTEFLTIENYQNGTYHSYGCYVLTPLKRGNYTATYNVSNYTAPNYSYSIPPSKW